MPAHVHHRILIALGSVAILAGMPVQAADEAESKELNTYSVGRTARPIIDPPTIEIERPKINLGAELAITPGKPSADVDAMQLPPLSLPSLATATASRQPQAEPDARTESGASSPGIAGALDRDIRPKEIQAPRFPREAALSGTTGHVVVEFTVTAEGQTDGISIVEAEPRGMFERSARAAVVRWTFEPAMANGKPVPRRVRQRLNFDL